MHVSRGAPTPLHHQIREQLRNKIEADEWPVGHVIPPETELAGQASVSRSTIRQAILELVREGYLYRVQGKGTVVTRRKVEPIAALTSFTENMRAMGVHPSHRVLEVAWSEPPRHVAEFLYGPSSPPRDCLYIHRLMLADDEPLSIQKAYLPGTLLAGKRHLFTPEHLMRRSLYELLEHECGVALWRAEELLDVSLTRADEAELLGIPSAQPTMIIRRYTYDRSEVPVEFVKHVFRADRYRYKITMFRTHSDRLGGVT